MLAKSISLISLYILSFFMTYWIMVFGWGLTLISWKWFVFGNISQGFILMLAQYLNKIIKEGNN